VAEGTATDHGVADHQPGWIFLASLGGSSLTNTEENKWLTPLSDGPIFCSLEQPKPVQQRFSKR
jgi:hypothetical protein